MHSTLICNDTSPSRQNNTQVVVLGNKSTSHSWGLSKKSSVEGTLGPKLCQWKPPAAWHPLGNVATSKPVVVCLRKEPPVEQRSPVPSHVGATTKRPAVEHLRKAGNPYWTALSKAAAHVPLSSARVTNGAALRPTTVEVSSPSEKNSIKASAQPGTVRFAIVSPRCSSLAGDDRAKRCETSVALAESAKAPSGIAKHAPPKKALVRPAVEPRSVTKEIKAASKPPTIVPRNTDIKPKLAEVAKDLKSRCPVKASRTPKEEPRKVQRKLHSEHVASSKNGGKKEVLSHKAKDTSDCLLKTIPAEQLKCTEKLLPHGPKTSGTVQKHISFAKEETKLKASPGADPSKVLASRVSKDPPPRPRRAGRKRSLELADDVQVVGSKRLDKSMQVPQRRVSVDNSFDDCPMPLLEPLVEDKGAHVTAKKDEPSSPEMPMLLPVIVKPEAVTPSTRIQTRQSQRDIETERQEGNAVVDTIDGVDFYSFSCEEDLEEFSREFEEAHSMEECTWSQSLTADDSELLNSEVADSKVLLPRKTNDITKIKGWRKKTFGADKPVSDVKQEEMTASVTEMSKGVRSAFVSDSLNDFLENKSELRVVHLAKLNPNINPPPEGAGVLSLRSPTHISQDVQEGKGTESKRPTRAGAAAAGRYSTRKPSAASYSTEHSEASPANPATKPVETPQAPKPTRRSGRPPRTKPSPTEIKSEVVDDEDTPFFAMTSRNLRPSTVKSTPEAVLKQSPTPSQAKTTTAQTPVTPAKPSPKSKTVVSAYGAESDYEIIRDSFVTDAQEILLKALLGWCQQYDITLRAQSAEKEPAFICPQLDHQDAVFASEALLAYEVYTGKSNSPLKHAKGKSPAEETTPPKTLQCATSSTVKTPVTAASSVRTPTTTSSSVVKAPPVSAASVVKSTPATSTSTSASLASPPTPGGIQGTTRSRRPIRLPARFQDSALLLPSGGDLWDLSPQRSLGPRQRPKTTVDSTKTTPTHVAAGSLAATVSTPPLHSTVAQARPSSSVAHGRLQTTYSVSACRSPMSSSSSSSSSSSMSSSSSEASYDGGSPPQSDIEEDEGDPKELADFPAEPRTVKTPVVPCAVQETSSVEKDSLEENSNEIDIETVSDLTDSTPTLLSDDDGSSLDKQSSTSGLNTVPDMEMMDLDALEGADSFECKASRERIRRRVMLSLFINLQNTVFDAPSTMPKVAVLPKVAILTQAVKYLNGLKALSLHLDGEKRRLRQRHSQLEAQLKVAKSGGTVRLEPGPAPRAMPRAVTAVCDIQSPTLKPLCDVATEVLFATQRKRLAQDEQVTGPFSGASGASPPKPKKAKSEPGAIANGKKKLGRISVTTKKPGTLAPGQVTEQDETSQPGASYKLDGSSIGSLRPLAPKAAAPSPAATTVTPAPTSPGSPQKYTLYPARGTMLGDLSKVAAVAQHLIGPCVIKRVKLRTGQTVLIYRKSPTGEGGEPGENDKEGMVLVPEEGTKAPLISEENAKHAASALGTITDSPQQQVPLKKLQDNVVVKSDSQGAVKVAETTSGSTKAIPIQRPSSNARAVVKTDRLKVEKGAGDSLNQSVRTSHGVQALTRKTFGEIVHTTNFMSAQACAKGLVGPSRTARSAPEPQPFVRTFVGGLPRSMKPLPAPQNSPRPVPVRITAAKDSPFLPGNMWGIARTTVVDNSTPPVSSASKDATSSVHEEREKEAVQGTDLKKGADADVELGDMSEWVSGDGEMCIIRKLPVDSEVESDEDSESNEGRENIQHRIGETDEVASESS